MDGHGATTTPAENPVQPDHEQAAMSEAHPTARGIKNKPEKPRPDFPLFPHQTGRWAKKIKGRMHYFGPWFDPDGALERYHDFLAGKPGEDPTRPPESSVRRQGGSRPAKPLPDFPLFPHATRRWAKKILGKLHYFGPWEDPNGALARYLEQKDDLYAGRKPRTTDDGQLTVRDLLNRFLTSKRHLLDTGEITPRTFNDYHATCDRVGTRFGLTRALDDLRPDDFEGLRADLARTLGPVSLGNEIQRVRVVFKYAYDAGLAAAPIRYGPGFKRPSKKTLRKARAAKGLRMFDEAALRRMIGAAGIQLRAMTLLGVNCGYGNADIGTLPIGALDLDHGWATFPRPKTGIMRRAALWPETMKALRAALARRPEPKDPAAVSLVFVTKYGGSWAKASMDNPVSKETAKLLRELGLSRPGLNFYALRHTFETIGGESRDQVAVDHIVGHARDDMASVYREKVSNERLKAVSDHVRAWLFPRRKAARN
jgi:integrase